MPPRSTVQPVLRLTHEAISRHDAAGVTRITGERSQAFRPNEYPYDLQLPPVDGPLHFTHRMALLCKEIVHRLPLFSHIRMEQVLVTYVRSRKNRLWGLQAKLVPLRFQDGKRTQQRRGHEYQVQQLYVGQTELRYVLSFYLPRFLNQSFDEKMITIVHELYHIGPRFAGEIRRIGPRGSAHGGSHRRYDAKMAKLAREYMATKPDASLHDFLRLSFDQLQERYGAVVGVHIPAPKLIPVQAVKGHYGQAKG